MIDENVEREKAWAEFVSNNGLTYAAEQQLRVAFIGGWVRGRASRPREAGSGGEGLAQAAAACQSIALGYEAQAGEWNANAKAYAARECARAIHALRRGATHAQSHPSPGGGNAQVGGATERAAGIVPQAGSNVAPEACPVRWLVCPNGDTLSEHAIIFESEREALRHVDYQMDGADPGAEWGVVPLYATPASAAGREGVARFIEECDERHNHRCACYAMSMENRRCDEAKSIAAIRALLAAEVEAEGGAK